MNRIYNGSVQIMKGSTITHSSKLFN